MNAAANSPPEFTDIQIPIPGGHVAGRWYGDQMVRPILVLHGWQDNCGSFARLVPLLMPYASFLCIDLPGHGRSSHLPIGIPYRSNEYISTILRIMKLYDWPKISLIGHSMGGYIAYYFSALYPKLVDMLITIDIVKSYCYTPDQEIGSYRFQLERIFAWNERLVYASIDNEPPCYTHEQMEQLLYESTDHSILLENCKHILERNITKSRRFPDKYYFSRDIRVKALFDMNPTEPIAEVLAERVRSIPHQLIFGGKSTNITFLQSNDYIEYLLKHNPLFSVHTVPHGTHHFHLNDPVETAQLIIPFLKKHRPIATIQGESPAVPTKAKL